MSGRGVRNDGAAIRPRPPHGKRSSATPRRPGRPRPRARTAMILGNDLDPGEDRRSVRRRWTWSDPVAKCRVWGCQPCRAALPREGLESRAPLVAATSTPTPDLAAPDLRVAVPAAVLP